MPVIKLQTLIKANKTLAFDLSRSIDLHQISTTQTNEKAIAGLTSGLIGPDEWVTWKAKHFGFYQTLTSKITGYDRPHFFADEQVKGAFKSFTHEHHFTDHKEGTLLIDIFKYTSPLGFLGQLADHLFLKRYMTRFLIQRNTVIKTYAESGRWREVLEEMGY